MNRSRQICVVGLFSMLILGGSAAVPHQGDLGFFEKAFQYARSVEGPNMFPDDARKFAERFAALTDGPRALQVFQDAYKYSRNVEGPNLFPPDAMKFADRLAARKDGDKVLGRYKEAYQLARKPTGLNLFPNEAMKFAEKQSGLLDPEKPPELRPLSVKKVHPGRVEAIKRLADLSKTLADGQKEADQLIDLASTAKTDADRIALDARLTKLVEHLKATTADLETISLAPTPPSPKP